MSSDAVVLQCIVKTSKGNVMLDEAMVLICEE